MRGKLKIATAILIVLILILSIFAPTMKVFAKDAYTITFTVSGSQTIEPSKNPDGSNRIGELKIEEKNIMLVDSTNNPVGTVSVASDGKSATINVTSGENTKLTFNSGEKFSLFVGDSEYVMDTEFSASTNIIVKDYVAPSNPQGGGNNNGGENNPPPSGNENYKDIKINATFSNASGEIIINNQRATGNAGEVQTYTGTAIKVGYTDSSKKNEITIRTAYGENIAKTIKINGNLYEANGTDSNTFEVAGAETYTIIVEGIEDPNAPKTLIWTNPDYVPTDEEDAEWVSQFSIEHGSARIIAVYDKSGNKLEPSEYIKEQEQPDGSKSDKYGLTKGFGWISVKQGYKATFEFYPEYGYQLTSVAINQQPMTASTTTNQFTVEIPNGNLQFAAKFTKTEDIVKAESEKVSSGTIKISNNEFDGGTAQLSVSDIELSSDKITGFETAAGDYTISNYLDIDLYNVFYKGKADSDDVWANKIDELNNEATITLQLAEGVNADDIVIVHNVHDGDQFEVINIESYDAETNTITFKTKSFSNYAIATKTSASTSTSTSLSPKTGDTIMAAGIVLAISIVGLGVTFVAKKNKK